MGPGKTERLQDNDQKWEALLKISEEAHTAVSLEDFAATIHKILSGLVRARNFFIGLYDESSRKYFFPYFEDEYDTIETAGVESGYDENLQVTLYDLSDTLTDYVRRSGKSLIFPNVELSRMYENGEIKLFGSQSFSWLGVPLKLSGKTVGVMTIQDYETVEGYSPKDEELMVFVSDHIARAIENVMAEDKIRKQHRLVLKQSEAITDSIHYARRIQRAVLPSPPYMHKILPDHFVVYKPKDIIGGDFYWVREISGYHVVIVADCTGHGVPGALMSMLGVTLLNEQFRTYGVQSPEIILNNLRDKVKEILAPDGADNDQKDGMDMSIAIIDHMKNQLLFAGANRPLYLVRKKEEGHELITVKGDKQPVGKHWDEQPFSLKTTSLQHEDSFYMFTDGYVDQYGGIDRKKFKLPQFRELLLSVQGMPMDQQKKIIVEKYDEWRGNLEQIDDVCVFGWDYVID